MLFQRTPCFMELVIEVFCILFANLVPVRFSLSDHTMSIISSLFQMRRRFFIKGYPWRRSSPLQMAFAGHARFEAKKIEQRHSLSYALVNGFPQFICNARHKLLHCLKAGIYRDVALSNFSTTSPKILDAFNLH